MQLLLLGVLIGLSASVAPPRRASTPRQVANSKAVGARPKAEGANGGDRPRTRRADAAAPRQSTNPKGADKGEAASGSQNSRPRHTRQRHSR